MTLVEIAVAYAIIAVSWSICCFRYAHSIPAFAFACLFWPLDAGRRLCEGARDWWRA